MYPENHNKWRLLVDSHQLKICMFWYGLKWTCPYGKKSWEPITPYLKKLHFLPVRFRILFKTALLVFKCVNNFAPKYLSELIKVRNTNLHHLRNDNDFFLLSHPYISNFKITHGAFSYYGPTIWNVFKPFSLCCLNDIKQFKINLKTHYFNLAYNS